ncbi:MAG: BON domain-containing protein [Acidobacteria bacterium]|nr:BON domain-containing protein [Acidobacteriota bacterium]
MRRLQRRLPALLIAALLAAGPAAAAVPSDAKLATAVAQRFAGAKGLSRELLRVSVQQGVASISGVVSDLSRSWRAREEAGSVAGIVEIVDRTTVRGAGRPDAELLAAVEAALRKGKETARLPIAVSVEAGRVTLTGTISDGRRRFDAREAAARVPGVIAVVDRLETPPSDDVRIREWASAQLDGSAGEGVDGRYAVTVAAGVVTLRGTAPTVRARDQAARTVLGINGVKELSNEVTVVP